MSARLIHRGWLLRGIELSLPDGVHVVEYNGRGFGYEQVSVDGGVIRKSSYWFVPRFAFNLGGYPSVVEVRVWPWLSLRSLVLRVGDRVVYAEGTCGWDRNQIELPHASNFATMCRARARFTVRGMMAAVLVVALACFAHEHLFVGYVTQCYGGRTVPIEFAINDSETGDPVLRARLTLSGRGSRHHTLETGPDGRALLAFQPGCDVRIYLLWGVIYTVHYSNWALEIEAEGYESVRRQLSSYREDTCYSGAAVPPPICVSIKRRDAP
jgi:hypothetical protein